MSHPLISFPTRSAQRNWSGILAVALKVLHIVALALFGGIVYVWAQSYCDEFRICYDRQTAIQYFAYRGWFYAVREPLQCPSLKRFHWGIAGQLYAPDVWLFAFPLAPLALVLSAWGCYPFLPQYRCWQRRRIGLCIRCGYCLKGLVEARCPECGHPFDMAKIRRIFGEQDTDS